MTTDNLPGPARHQAVLKGIVQYYKDDLRIEAVVLFGSLGRGDWDEDSDIDLDVVTAEQVEINIPEELHRLCEYLAKTGEPAAGAKPALIIPTGPDEGDVVFESLLMLSVRYHPLETTKPAILDGLRILTGKLGQAEIVAAGLRNRQDDKKPLRPLLDRLLRYVVVADVAIRRQNIWLAIEVLHRMRALCMDLFTHARNGQRSFYFFEEQAEGDLQERLGKTLPQYHLASLRQSLGQFMTILENDTGVLTNGKLALAETDKEIVRRVRSNQALPSEG